MATLYITQENSKMGAEFYIVETVFTSRIDSLFDLGPTISAYELPEQQEILK